ncbi:hypothetical protein PR202_gb13969 [Eleusine coracana subsp. coracana]|uniref:Uncharacterized protein n=1 Tax=Eleusine coracana subsp. coracana TaxID=191504 RepID=A0AAV5EVF5_ELECO|nr:hypothetical protein PR202_gb13969 [Eleusine coracana subsp. coracana]
MSSARELRRPGGRSSTKLQKIFAGTALTVSLKLSVVCLGCGIYVAARGSSTDCITFLQWGFIAVALVLLFNFIIVVKFYYRHKETTSSLYLLIMLLALLTLLSLMIAAFVHINIKPVNDGPRLRNINDLKALDKPQPVREYSLGDYRGQLKRQVGESRFWARISGCLLRRHPCNGMSPLFLDPNSGVLLANRTSNKFPDDPGLSPIEVHRTRHRLRIAPLSHPQPCCSSVIASTARLIPLLDCSPWTAASLASCHHRRAWLPSRISAALPCPALVTVLLSCSSPLGPSPPTCHLAPTFLHPAACSTTPLLHCQHALAPSPSHVAPAKLAHGTWHRHLCVPLLLLALLLVSRILVPSLSVEAGSARPILLKAHDA